MGSHPINLMVRFLLELSALSATGVWGWKLSEGWIRFGLALGIPIIIAVVWGTFAVPNDPSRSGSAPIVVPGIVRLAIELSIFAFATWVLHELGYIRFSRIFGTLVVLHYIFSYDRVRWLLSQ